MGRRYLSTSSAILDFAHPGEDEDGITMSGMKSKRSASAAAGSPSANPLDAGITSSLVLDYIYNSPEDLELKSTLLDPDATHCLAQHVTYLLRGALLHAKMIAQMSKRDHLIVDDFLRAAGRMWQIPDENRAVLLDSSLREEDGKEVLDISKLLAQRRTLPTLASVKENEPIYRAHWLAIDGVQPATPENSYPASEPAPATTSSAVGRPVEGIGSGNPGVNSEREAVRNRLRDVGSVAGGNHSKFRTTMPFVVKTQLAAHEMSMEHQLLYLGLTEALIGRSELKRKEALLTLETEPGVRELLPKLSTWILEGIRINLANAIMHNLTYILRGVLSLLENKYISLIQYLHDIIPAVASCVVSKILSDNPQYDHHWVVRDYAAKLLKTIADKYNNNSNRISVRLMRMFTEALTDPGKSLASVFGAISAIGEFGTPAVRAYLMPRVKAIAERVQGVMDSRGSTAYDRLVANKICLNISKYVAQCMLKDGCDPDEDVEEYKAKFGLFGSTICTTVMKMDDDPSYKVVVYQPPAHILALVEAQKAKCSRNPQ